MKRRYLAAALLFPTLAFAEWDPLTVIKQSNQVLDGFAEACMYTGRTAYIRLRLKESTAVEERKLEECIGEGKEAAKKTHTEIKALFKKKSAPPELAEWRLEWMAAFDATALKSGEVESQYLRRVQDARSKVERATNKLEVSME